MAEKNEHPGIFKDPPEERVLHITVNLRPEFCPEQGRYQKAMLDEMIHQTMLETGHDTPADSLSSRLQAETPRYEARIHGNGTEIYFHELGGACMKMVHQAGIIGATNLDTSWRINSAQAMQRPVVLE